MSKYLLAVPLAFALGGFFQPEGELPQPETIQSERTQAVRERVDLARGRRWVLEWDGLAVYDVATARLVRRVILPGAVFAGARGVQPPDLVLSRSGAAIVSSNAMPRLWRVSPERFEVEVYDLALASDADKDFGFTSLAWGVGERTLLAFDAVGDTPWRIDLRSATAEKLPAGFPVAVR